MLENELHNDLYNRTLCFKCIKEQFLSQKVRGLGKKVICFYCRGRRPSLALKDIVTYIEFAFEKHYQRTATDPDELQARLIADREESYEWLRDGEPVLDVISEATCVDERIAEDIRLLLETKHYDDGAVEIGEETEFSKGSYYAKAPARDDLWQEYWSVFENSLKSEARFFNHTAHGILKRIFDGIEKMRDSNGRPLILTVDSGSKYSSFFRARIFQKENQLLDALKRPDLLLGPPAAAVALAGRMNSRGISVFYGASDEMTAISEVRPPVGSRVLTGRFIATRQIKLLDLTALGDAMGDEGSIFDPEYATLRERLVFMRFLADRITKAVMPDDEPLEYLATQAIADFLASQVSSSIDGILFPSVQSGKVGMNVVIFHNSSRVEPLDRPTGMNIEATSGLMGEDAFEIDYAVWEWLAHPEVIPNLKAASQDDLEISSLVDMREATLKLDLSSLKVLHVRAATFDCVPHSVRRLRGVSQAIGTYDPDL